MPYFMVVNEQGPAWATGRPMREQAGWAEHAVFMDALEADRVVVLAGPLEGGPGHRALLILVGPDAATLRDRLGADPWMRSGVLRLGSLARWDLLLGELPRPPPAADPPGPVRT